MDTDELDWPPGPWETELRRLDELAKCPVCHDVYRIPLSLSCGHTYCSVCIRGNLDYQERQGQAKCPQCRHPCDTRDLRPCLGLKDLVETYFKARQLLIQAATQAAAATTSQLTPTPGRRSSGRLQKRQREAEAVKSTPQDRQQDEQQQSGRTSEAAHCRNAGAGNKEKEGVAAVPSTKSASTFIDMTRDDIGRKVRARPAASTPKESQEQAEKADAESDIEVTLTSDSSWGSGPPSQRTRRNAKLQRTREEQEGRNGRKGSSAAAQPNKVPRGYVECPVCTMQLRETLVNDHIDKCLQKASEADDFQPQAARAPPPAPVVSVLPRTKAKLEVPPKLVFSMLSNKELQAKLRAHKLPTDGRRHDWEQRYNKLRVEVQCAQDAGEDVTLEEIARRLGRREKQTAAAAFAVPRSKAPFTGASSFEELISRTRKREAKRSVAQEERAVSLPDETPSETPRERHDGDMQMQPSLDDGQADTGLGAMHRAEDNVQCQQKSELERCIPAQSMAEGEERMREGGKADDRMRSAECLPLDPLDPNVHSMPLQLHPGLMDHHPGNDACGGGSSGLKAQGSSCQAEVRGWDKDKSGYERLNAHSSDEVPDSCSEEEE